MPHYRMTTALSPDECCRLLLGAGGENQLFSHEILPYDTRILAVVSDSRFQLYRYAGYFNSFGFRFYGTIGASLGSTEIKGAVRMSVLGILALAGLPAILIALITLDWWPGQFELRALLVFGLLAATVFVVQGVIASRYAAPYLAFLQSRFNATLIAEVAA